MTPEYQQCRFQWGKCGNSTHQCGAFNIVLGSSLRLHNGFHHCGNCGFVYLRTFIPTRDDDVARWLKAHRDGWGTVSRSTEYRVIDELLDDYREHADTGTPLDAEIERGRM